MTCFERGQLSSLKPSDWAHRERESNPARISPTAAGSYSEARYLIVRYRREPGGRRSFEDRLPYLLLVMAVDQGRRSGDPQVERVLADVLAVEYARMVGLGALAHEGGIAADVDQRRTIENGSAPFREVC